jgi:hypothetical protein
MAATAEGPDKIMQVFEEDGSSMVCDPTDEPMLRQAVRAFADSGEDTLLDLTAICGGDFSILASRVTGWLVSTRETRRLDREIAKALRREAGWSPDGQ